MPTNAAMTSRPSSIHGLWKLIETSSTERAPERPRGRRRSRRHRVRARRRSRRPISCDARDAPDEARARRRPRGEAERVRPTHEALARGAALDDRRRPGTHAHRLHAPRHRTARARTAETDVGTREPPPATGMQPMNGRKVGALAELPDVRAEEDGRSRRRDPGVDRAAERPEEADVDRADAEPRVETADDVVRAGTSAGTRRAARSTAVDAGTTTHGPGTGDADHEPVALVRATCRRGDRERGAGDDERPERAQSSHGTLLKSTAEMVAAIEQRARRR